jgi:hypothetical protein
MRERFPGSRSVVSADNFAAVQQEIVRTWGVATEPCDCKWCGDVAAKEKDAETYVFYTACLRGYCYDEADQRYGDTDYDVIAALLARRPDQGKLLCL